MLHSLLSSLRLLVFISKTDDEEGSRNEMRRRDEGREEDRSREERNSEVKREEARR